MKVSIEPFPSEDLECRKVRLELLPYLQADKHKEILADLQQAIRDAFKVIHVKLDKPKLWPEEYAEPLARLYLAIFKEME